MGDTPGVSGTFEKFTEITYLNLHFQECIGLSSLNSLLFMSNYMY